MGFDQVMGLNFRLLYTVEDFHTFETTCHAKTLPFYHVIDIYKLPNC
jgi:hypothetical protein